MTEPLSSRHALHDQRERTVRLLCDGFADDRLEMADFEARLDAANRARTGTELAALVQDLTVADRAPARSPARDALASGGRAVREAVRDSRTILALMAGIERRGHWAPARRNVVIAVMGGAVLDFRDVVLPAGRTDVNLFCFMGGAEVIVPEGMAVDASGIAIMGGFEHAPSRSPAPGPDTPVLRITGICIMGGAEIRVRRPGESARDARLREREERRALRERNRQDRTE